MLPQKIFENLHTVVVILLLFEQFLAKFCLFAFTFSFTFSKEFVALKSEGFSCLLIFTLFELFTMLFIRATWYQLITSLAISDLISAIISPFQLYIFTWGFATYTWPNVICIVSI